jgi:glycosyltransferase involved in cell wall biosynthesis
MTLIIAAGKPDSSLPAKVDQFRRVADNEFTEVIVACDTPWLDAPPWLRVVVTGSGSRGDTLDRASEIAHGELLAFVDQSVRLSTEWQRRAIELMKDSKIGAVGGPLVLPTESAFGERASSTLLRSWFGSGPLYYRFRLATSRDVPELPTTNLVVRRRAFLSVGGFQSPSPLGDDARLCYKIRSLLRLRIVYDPALAVESPPPALPQPCLGLMMEWGRHRGDMWRRLPEASHRLLNQLPSIAVLGMAMLAVISPFALAARLCLGLVAGFYVLAAIWMAIRSRDARAGLVAGLCLPLIHGAYGIGFLRGYLGRSLGETVPGRFRPKHLRILIFNWRDITHPRSGGAEVYIHELARRWVQAGCEVGWVSERYRTGKPFETIDGIRFHRVGRRLSIYPLACAAYLLRLRRRYDVIVDCENGIPFFTPLYSRKPSILVVYHVHQEVFRRELSVYSRWLALWLEGWLMPRVYRNRVVVTISQSTRDDLVRQGYDPARVTVVESGVDSTEPDQPKSWNRVPLLLYLGRLKKYKSVDVLLRAMPDVLSRFPETKVAIVGQGPEREPLERLSWKLGLAESVRFHGYLERADRDRLLGEAWIAVCPSQFEGWGVVCLEANAHGTPVIASRVPGLKDAVIDGVTGVLVPYGNSDALAQQLIALIDDGERRKVLSRFARVWAAEHNWNGSSHAFLAKLSEVASGSGRKSRTEAASVPDQGQRKSGERSDDRNAS